jgi:hypothetical protein
MTAECLIIMLAMPDSDADDCTDSAIAFRLGQLGHELVAEASEVPCSPPVV